MKYLRGGDRRKNEEEKRSWEERRKRKIIAHEDPVEAERIEREKKRKVAEEFIKTNPSLLETITLSADIRAMKISKGNERIAKTLSKGLIYTVAYEIAMESQ